MNAVDVESMFIVTCPVVAEFVDYDLDHYRNNDLQRYERILKAPNGYYYFPIDGLTITFYLPLNGDELLYHIVVCEIEQSELERMNLTYEQLMRLKPTFTFDLDELGC